MNDSNTQSNFQQMDTEEKQLDIGLYIKAVWQNKWKVVAFTFGVAIIATLFILKLPSIYEAKATLFLTKDNQAPVSMADAFSMDMQSREYLQTQFSILKSETLALQVIEELGLKKLKQFDVKKENSFSLIQAVKSKLENFVGESQNDSVNSVASFDDLKEKAVINWYLSNLSVSPIDRTQLVEIKFQSEDPQLAADISNTLGNVYINSFLNAKMEQTDKAIEWLQSRNIKTSEELAQAEAALQAFINKEQIVSMDSGMQSLNEETLRNLNERLLDVRDQRIRLENILNQTKSAEIIDKGILSQFSESIKITQLSNAELIAEQKFTEISQRYGPKHPKYIAAETELKQVSAKLASQMKAELGDLSQKLSNLKRTEASLQKELSAAETRFLSDSGKEAEFNKLKANVARLTELNDLITKRFKELDITSDFNAENARFIDVAKAPLYPVKPKKMLLLIGVIIASAGFATAVVLLITFLNNTFRRSVEVEEELQAKFLGLVPKIALKKKSTLPLHIYFDKEYRLFTEAVKTIRTGYMLGQLNRESTVTLVTSAVPGEGKTTTSINLAFTFGQMEKVLLIDADLRKPSVAKRFGLPAYQHGLSDVLSGSVNVESCITSDEKSGIDILPAGQYTHNALELFAKGHLSSVIGKLKQEYTKIIIDSAPCQAVSDTLMISKFADSTIFVVKADSTKKQIVKAAVNRIRDAGALIDGVILNSADTSKSNTEYSGYYDYYGYAEEK
mgnify:CR=1 FL=1